MFKIENMPNQIDIGFTGEKSFRKVEIDMTAWMEIMPEGVPSIVHIRPGEGTADAYIVNTTFADNVLTWEVAAGDLGEIEGTGIAQIWLEAESNDSVVKRGKSILVTTLIHAALNDASETVPEAQGAWLEAMTALKVATVNAKEAAETAQENAEIAEDYAVDAAYDAQEYRDSARAADTSARHYANLANLWANYDTEHSTPSSSNNAQAYAESANASQQNAYQFSQNALAAKTAAETAQGKAEAAQGKAETAQEKAEFAQGKAESAWRAASSSATDAYSYASSAQRYSGQAASSAADAYSAKTDAEDAKDEILGMTATATGLPAGSAPTVSYSNGVMAFGIPKGDKGDPGGGGGGDLPSGGTTGQVLTKQSNDDGDADWEDIPSDNTKADKEDTVLTTTLSRGRKTNTTVGTGSFAFGYNVEASGDYSHAEGSSTKATESYSHAEGNSTKATGAQSHAEGIYSEAKGSSSHAEGYGAVSDGDYSHAEGTASCADAYGSHAEGDSTVAAATASHSEGRGTFAYGKHGCHAGGLFNFPTGGSFPAWKANTKYIAGTSFIKYSNVVYLCKTTHTSGSSFDSSKWDVIDDEYITNETVPLETIGNGIGGSIVLRSNARMLDEDGNEYLAGDVYVGCEHDSSGGTKVAKVTDFSSADIGVTIEPSDWSQTAPYSYTWTDSRVTAGCDVEVYFDESAVDCEISYIEYEKATGSITFTADTLPSEDLLLIVKLTNAEAVQVASTSADMVSQTAIPGAGTVEQALNALNTITDGSSLVQRATGITDGDNVTTVMKQGKLVTVSMFVNTTASKAANSQIMTLPFLPLKVLNVVATVSSLSYITLRIGTDGVMTTRAAVESGKYIACTFSYVCQ